jgi:hypothetical protein
MVGDGNGSATRSGDDGLNAKDNLGRVGASAAAAVREAGGLFRSGRARHSVSGSNGGS